MIADLEKHGFINRGGKTISGYEGDDAKKYQEKAIKAAIAEAKG